MIRSEEAGMPERFETTTDPMCGMRVDPDTAPAHVEFEGATYYFCSRHCSHILLGPRQVLSPPRPSKPLQVPIGDARRNDAAAGGSVMRRRTGAQRDPPALNRRWTTATYTVEGMRCGACIAEVMEGIRLLPGVSGVAIHLVPDGRSPLFIESRVALAPEVVRETVEMVGFHATDTRRHLARHLHQKFTA